MDSTIIKIDKLVHGGQGLGIMPDGRKAFVWNALPGEEVHVRLIKKRRDYVEAIAEEILVASPERIEPEEAIYLSTSPWQIMTFDSENKNKEQVLQETFTREHIELPTFTFLFGDSEFEYRNKMEYSFWGDEDGLHLALHQRGTSGKQIVNGSKLALPAVDKAANKVLAELQNLHIRAGSLKTLVVRCNQQGSTVASLFVKDEDFAVLSLPSGLQGLSVYYSNPKSPASVATKLLLTLGNVHLQDNLLGKEFVYSADSFFQVNLPIFETALTRIKEFVGNEPAVDMYGGVGTIGLSVSSAPVIIELDDTTAAMAKINAADSKAEVVHAQSEKALDYIVSNKLLIVDPPRAGLHKDVIARILATKPGRIIYLSCNPVTQARDVALLKDAYNIGFFEGYNFFPRTPHIESLAILQRT